MMAQDRKIGSESGSGPEDHLTLTRRPDQDREIGSGSGDRISTGRCHCSGRNLCAAHADALSCPCWYPILPMLMPFPAHAGTLSCPYWYPILPMLMPFPAHAGTLFTWPCTGGGLFVVRLECPTSAWRCNGALDKGCCLGWLECPKPLPHTIQGMLLGLAGMPFPHAPPPIAPPSCPPPSPALEGCLELAGRAGSRPLARRWVRVRVWGGLLPFPIQ